MEDAAPFKMLTRALAEAGSSANLAAATGISGGDLHAALASGQVPADMARAVASFLRRTDEETLRRRRS